MSLDRRSFLLASLAAGAAGLTAGRSFADEPILVGVSGPLTGPNAQYGAQWKDGFDLAVAQINAAGGPPIQYVFEDSQSDPRQAVTIAQKFVNDPRIVAELGDFSSTASMAASPIYNRTSCSSSESPTPIPTIPRPATTPGAIASARRTSSRRSPNT